MEIKQHTSEQPMGQKRSQRGNQKFTEKKKKKMEAQYATNAILRGKFRGINTCIKKNKDIKYTAQLYLSRN